MTITVTEGGFIATGEGITRYQVIVVKQGLKACKRGMRLNRAYTPKNLRALTERFVGRKFKARDYDGMIAAIDEELAKDA